MAFGNDAFAFLAELEKNNDRDWFKANQARYEAAIRTPALEFIEEVAMWFEGEKLPYKAEAKKAGGSLTKILRDVRFAKDKSPYQSHVVIHFSHKNHSRDAPMPALGIRWDASGDLGMGGGLYGGDTKTLNKVRDAIIARPDEWANAKSGLDLWGDTLKTAPKGYDPEHPLIEDLRRKAFMSSVPITKQQFKDDLLSTFVAGARQVLPFNRFLASALE